MKNVESIFCPFAVVTDSHVFKRNVHDISMDAVAAVRGWLHDNAAVAQTALPVLRLAA